MISCHKGLAPVSFPAVWLEEFEGDASFAMVGEEGRIRFAVNGLAFGVSVESYGPRVERFVRRLSAEEIGTTPWGGFCAPWEPYKVMRAFGHGPVTSLDQVLV